MAFTVVIDSKSVQNTLKAMPVAVRNGLHAAADKAGKAFFAEHRRVALSAKTQASSGPIVSNIYNPRSFAKRRLLKITGDSLNDLKLSMFITSGAAVQHEIGAIMSAKNPSRLLPVPMPAAKRANGSLTAKAKGLLRDFRHQSNAASAGFDLVRKRSRNKRSGLFQLTSRDGRKFLVERSRDGGLTFFFHLEQRIKLKPRFLFYETWRQFTPKAMQIFRQSLPAAIKKAIQKGVVVVNA
jgi:hypothetical protein